MTRHSFDPYVALLTDTKAAVIYQNISFWVEKNEANGTNFRDGRYWTYNSIAAFQKLFPYLSEKQIRTAIDMLVDAGLILKANYASDRYDRTTWYALGKSICPPGQMDLPPGEDASVPAGEWSAPGGKSRENRYNPDDKPDHPSKDLAADVTQAFEAIWAVYPEDRRSHLDACADHIAEALKEASAAELTAAARAYGETTREFTRSRVHLLHNWLRFGKWREAVQAQRRRQVSEEAAEERVLAQAAAWVKNRHPMSRHVSRPQVVAAVKRGLLTIDEARAAGVM